MYVTISFCFYVCTVCTYGTNPSNCVYILHYSLKLYIIHMPLLLQNCMRMCGQMVSKPCIYCTVHSKPLNCISILAWSYAFISVHVWQYAFKTEYVYVWPSFLNCAPCLQNFVCVYVWLSAFKLLCVYIVVVDVKGNQQPASGGRSQWFWLSTYTNYPPPSTTFGQFRLDSAKLYFRLLITHKHLYIVLPQKFIILFLHNCCCNLLKIFLSKCKIK